MLEALSNDVFRNKAQQMFEASPLKTIVIEESFDYSDAPSRFNQVIRLEDPCSDDGSND
jgi:hypothetical protein